MGSDQIVALLRHTIETALWMGGPLLIAAVVVGLLINVVQVLTSLQEHDCLHCAPARGGSGGGAGC